MSKELTESTNYSPGHHPVQTFHKDYQVITLYGINIAYTIESITYLSVAATLLSYTQEDQQHKKV